MKTLVSHFSTDLDAVASSWLITRYLPDWNNPSFKFVSAGKTLDDKLPDEDPNIIHVDTGLGRFDHHQFASDKLSATKRVYDYLLEKQYVKRYDQDALGRIADFATMIDHFGEVHFPDPTSDLYDFSLYRLIEGMKAIGKKDEEIMQHGFILLDGVLELFKKKINAEEEIKGGFIFENKWGKAIALDTQNEETMKMALKQGYRTVAKRNPKTHFIRIKTLPDKDIDLTPVHEEILKADPKDTWFLHSGKHMLLNGSSKSLDSKASSLTLKKVIEILQSIA